MELSQPPLIIAFELSEACRARPLLTELDEAVGAEALRKVGKQCARQALHFLLWRKACRLFGDAPFLDLCILFGRLLGLRCLFGQSKCPQSCCLFTNSPSVSLIQRHSLLGLLCLLY